MCHLLLRLVSLYVIPALLLFAVKHLERTVFNLTSAFSPHPFTKVSSYLFFLIYLLLFKLIYFCLCWVFVAACRLSLVAVSGGYSSLQCAGFSLRWLLLLWSMGSLACGLSSCGSQALECRLSSRGARA